MAGPDRPLPYQKAFWSNNQKRAPNAEFDRFLLLGALIGDDDELVIRRLGITGLTDLDQMVSPVASQTGLHLQILDTRNVMALKISKAVGNNANFIKLYNIATDGTETAVAGGAVDSGAWTDPSLRELKADMKDLTDNQITKILEKLNVYRFRYADARDITYVSPEAEEFHKLTGWGDGESLSPSTIAGIALRCVQFVWKFVDSLDARLKAIETQLAKDAPKV
jgi:hypothetical protein